MGGKTRAGAGTTPGSKSAASPPTRPLEGPSDPVEAVTGTRRVSAPGPLP